MRLRDIAVALVVALIATQPVQAASPDRALTRSRPKSSAVNSVSNFDAALRCMDEMLLRTEFANSIPLLVGPLDDASGVVGVSTRDMLLAAAARMSERSHFFLIYAQATQDKIKAPMLVTGGSITGFDKAVEGGKNGIGIGVGLSGFGLSRDNQIHVITLTIYFNNADMTVVPRSMQSVQMALQQKDAGGDLSAGIGQAGITFDFDASQAEGIHQAVRALIDLAMIQAVGSYAQVPYERCLSGEGTDPAAIQIARKTFDAMKPPAQINAIATALASKGLVQGTPLSVVTPELRQAIAAFQAQRSMPALGLPTFDVYYALFQDRFGVPTTPAEAPMNDLVGVRIAAAGSFFLPASSGAYVIERTNRAQFSINTASPAYVSCYYTDSSDRTTRVFPNKQRPAVRLGAGDPLLIPGPGDRFTIEARKAGKEALTCLAAPQPFEDLLPRALTMDLTTGQPALTGADPETIITIARQAGIPNLSSNVFRYVICDQIVGGHCNSNAN